MFFIANIIDANEGLELELESEIGLKFSQSRGASCCRLSMIVGFVGFVQVCSGQRGL